MREKSLEATVKKAEELSTATGNLVNSLTRFEDANDQSFDLTKTIRGADSTTSQIVARIYSVAGVVAEFEKATRAELTPLLTLTNLQQAIDETVSSANNIIKQVENLKQAHGGLQSFNYANFHALTRNGNTHNLDGHFQALYNATEGLLQRFFESLFILKPKASYSFQGAANALSLIIEDTKGDLATLKKSLKQVSLSEESLAATQDQATKQLDEIKRLKTDSDSDRKTIAEYLAQATQERAAVQATSEEASKLQAAVKNYQQTFEQFQQKLDEREGAFSDGKVKLGQLLEAFEQQRSSVTALISQSEKMLSSATVAGLAANFRSMMDKLTSELKWARAVFYIGIVFLTISAFPLLAFVLMPLASPILQSMFPNLTFPVSESVHTAAGDGWQYLGQVLARVAILLPAAWFVSFTAIRHSSLFRLREHYAYKYSMAVAVAVEGFKQQAPAYKQEIAALVLEQLAFNPADKLVPSKEIREGKAPGIMGYLLDQIRTRVEATVRTEQK